MKNPPWNIPNTSLTDCYVQDTTLDDRNTHGSIIEINYGSSKGQILLHFSKNEIVYLNFTSERSIRRSVTNGFPGP